MGYLLWFGIVALVFVLMHFFTGLSGKQKGLISLIITLLVAGAIAYNIQSDRDRKHLVDVELKYRHGETLMCQGVEINSSNFDYSVGTQSFVGNRGTKYFQQIINARECQ